MRVKEAAERLNLSRNWIGILCHRGFIEATKVRNHYWEITEEAFEAFIRDFDNDLHGWANHNGGINKSDIWGKRTQKLYDIMFEQQPMTYFI